MRSVTHGTNARGRKVAPANPRAALSPDLRRLARAVRQLEAERLADGSWQVSGGVGVRTVDPGAVTCSCPDHSYRHCVCAHLVRVRLALGDAETVRALRELVP